MDNDDLQNEEGWKEMEKRHRRGKIMGGLLIVAVGSLFLARELGAELPFWLFSWKMLLIGIGIIVAVKHKFLHPAWVLLVGVGGIFLMNDIYPEMNIRPIMWPIIVIMAGLFIIFKPRRKYSARYRRHWDKWHRHHYHHYRQHEYWQKYQKECAEGKEIKDDYVESTSFMAGVKKNILSKKFKGGEITNIFGSTELNLTQADIEGSAKLDVTQVFGGTRLIVPANWEIKSELVTVMGSVEDKRPTMQQVGTEPAKLLILSGDTFFGGIEIRSY